MQEAFGVESKQVTFEQSIRFVDIQRHGRIDLLLGDLAFEFKRRKSYDNAPRQQLKRYLQQLKQDQHKTNCIGFMTDGLHFEVWEADSFAPLDRFDLSTLAHDVAFTKLDAYLFSQTQTKPTAQDVVERFGSSSPIFRKVEAELKRLLEQVADFPKIEVWRKQWGNLLSRVYGTDVGDDNLFIRHTYLCQFARLIGYATLKQQLPQLQDIPDIINGKAFGQFGVKNIGENDFFSWILMDEIQASALSTFFHLANGLTVYTCDRLTKTCSSNSIKVWLTPPRATTWASAYTPIGWRNSP
ncbi:MAG UNVERIFIED_CONTAM: hypothetical protein LVT10_27565 [Anaerolineae bacterium]